MIAEPDEWYKKFNEQSELELGRIDGLVPFFILCGILLVAFVFFLVTGG